MGRIVNGRDQDFSGTVVRQGREFRTLAAYNAFASDGRTPDSRQTPAGRRPVKRRPS